MLFELVLLQAFTQKKKKKKKEYIIQIKIL